MVANRAGSGCCVVRLWDGLLSVRARMMMDVEKERLRADQLAEGMTRAPEQNVGEVPNHAAGESVRGCPLGKRWPRNKFTKFLHTLQLHKRLQASSSLFILHHSKPKTRSRSNWLFEI